MGKTGSAGKNKIVLEHSNHSKAAGNSGFAISGNDPDKNIGHL